MGNKGNKGNMGYKGNSLIPLYPYFPYDRRMSARSEASPYGWIPFLKSIQEPGE
jgi:hypothetical protein